MWIMISVTEAIEIKTLGNVTFAWHFRLHVHIYQTWRKVGLQYVRARQNFQIKFILNAFPESNDFNVSNEFNCLCDKRWYHVSYYEI